MKAKNMSRYSLTTTLILIAAIVLLLIGTVGAARATLTQSETYKSQMAMKEIGLQLNENDAPASGSLLGSLLGEGEKLILGKEYDEKLSVTNTADIDEYVRVSIYKYWQDEEGKATDLSPALIKLTLGTDNWIVDDSATTDERMVLYYTKPLAAATENSAAETTSYVLTGISISSDVGKIVSQTPSADGRTITTTYKYDGIEFGLKVEVDGIQTHNAEEAAMSAWGRKITIESDGTLKLG